jgi:type IV pilus assembly protein PilB
VNNCKKLKSIIEKNNYLSKDKIAICLKESHLKKISLYQTILNFKFLDSHTLQKISSQITGYPFIDLSEIEVDKNCLSYIPFDFCETNKILCFKITEKNLFLATEDPQNILLIDKIKKDFAQDLEILPHHADYKKILNILQLSKKKYLSVSDTEKELISLIDKIIDKAVLLEASDVHIQPDHNLVNIKYRIDGILKNSLILHKDIFGAICVRLKIISKLDISESRKPQNGSFSKNIDGRNIDFRISTHPTIYGENIVIRILDPSVSVLTLEQLGFFDNDVEFLKKIIKRPSGMIINCGPTGSGKTTTMYALFQEINLENYNVMTLEQPIEYKIAGIRQTEILENSNLDFAKGMRSILRQDPDIIYISEIRDSETAKIALRASITGHLVLVTVHSKDCLGAITRLVELGINPSTLSENLLLIISQRLVRKICKICQAKGCDDCHNGFKGRTVVPEFLHLDDTCSEILAKFENNWRQNMKIKLKKTFLESSNQLIKKGLTNDEEIFRCLGFNTTNILVS